MMNDRVAMFAKQAVDYAAELYGPQRAGELVWEPLTYDRKFAQLIAQDCIAMIQMKMPRNGVNSAENLQSKKHIKDIAEAYGITLPLPSKAYEHIIDDVVAASDAILEGKKSITAADVQMLRERTDCPMMECKKALTACNGNMDEAVEYLRQGRLAGRRMFTV